MVGSESVTLYLSGRGPGRALAPGHLDAVLLGPPQTLLLLIPLLSLPVSPNLTKLFTSNPWGFKRFGAHSAPNPKFLPPSSACNTDPESDPFLLSLLSWALVGAAVCSCRGLQGSDGPPGTPAPAGLSATFASPGPIPSSALDAQQWLRS